MKNIKTTIDKFLERLEKRWEKLPMHKQRQYVLYSFSGFFLLMTIVSVKIFYDTIRINNTMIIEHLQNPIQENKKNPFPSKDTITPIPKNKTYERK